MKVILNSIPYRQVITGLIALLLVAGLVLVSLPKPAGAATCAYNHKVEAGETLTSIAAKYGVTWTAIAEANSLKEPYIIVVGQTLCIPPGGTVQATATTTTTSTKPGWIVTILKNYYFEIKTTKLAAKTSYYVRVEKPGRIPLIYKVGRLRTDKNGAVTATFRMPKELWNTKLTNTWLTFCLKNTLTDAVQCQAVKNVVAKK